MRTGGVGDRERPVDVGGRPPVDEPTEPVADSRVRPLRSGDDDLWNPPIAEEPADRPRSDVYHVRVRIDQREGEQVIAELGFEEPLGGRGAPRHETNRPGETLDPPSHRSEQPVSPVVHEKRVGHVRI